MMNETEVFELNRQEPLTLTEALFDSQLIDEIAQIPDRFAFKIGDVTEITNVKQYVLRYWETEFEDLRPKKAGNNQRMYTKRDVETVLLIRKLLHRDRFSIEGAKVALKNLRSVARKEFQKAKVSGPQFESIQDQMAELLFDIRRMSTYLS